MVIIPLVRAVVCNKRIFIEVGNLHNRIMSVHLRCHSDVHVVFIIHGFTYPLALLYIVLLISKEILDDKICEKML